ncbi:MAG: hypothetical protein JRJ12_17870 [Deltaproteobacteria bacterium]|nr:hypothetical protein [Deltaproteobacteria bacterium]
MRRKRKILRGMPALERLTRMDETTIRKCIEHEGFPAALINGRWRAVEEDVIEWMRERIARCNGADSVT